MATPKCVLSHHSPSLLHAVTFSVPFFLFILLGPIGSTSAPPRFDCQVPRVIEIDRAESRERPTVSPIGPPESPKTIPGLSLSLSLSLLERRLCAFLHFFRRHETLCGLLSVPANTSQPIAKVEMGVGKNVNSVFWMQYIIFSNGLYGYSTDAKKVKT